MKISPLAVLSCALFVLTFQVTVTDEANLPSMGYYAELVLDGNVADSVSSNIQSNTPITLTGDANNATINNVSITTDCRVIGQEAECRCQQSYVWSGSVCTSHPQCCLNETVCKMIVSNNTSMCLPKKRVTVRGTLTITDTFTEDLNDIKSVAYTNLAKKIEDQVAS
ncbi:adhesion G-protein coupled receptor F1-like [Huso huso]|uniref:Adhesion G-protein coupled receptor F1-like n=1 Tax=Huso huso TaxID=61971 RepID=A0ABR0ZUM1_HUSHU